MHSGLSDILHFVTAKQPGAGKPGDAIIEEDLLHGEDAGDSGN
jgi:hypothetical protein